MSSQKEPIQSLREWVDCLIVACITMEGEVGYACEKIVALVDAQAEEDDTSSPDAQ